MDVKSSGKPVRVMNDDRKKTVLTVARLAEKIGAELAGPGSGQIASVSGIATAGPGDVTFMTDKKHLDELARSKAGAVIVAERIEALTRPQLIVENVNRALITSLNIFAPKLTPPSPGVHQSAVVAETAKVAGGVSIGANVYIGCNAEVGDNTVIGTGCCIGENSIIGKNCRLDGNVIVYHNCAIGNNVIIQANSTIGSTGFGYILIDGEHRLIPHNGGVIIEDFVEIGANCCVDRAKFGNTIIGAGTKVDNLVQIAHNVVIGKCCLLVGQVGIAGSAELGDGVVLGGQAGVKDNIKIGDKAMIGGQSGVLESIAADKQVFGTPAQDIKKAFREIALTRRLPEMAEQLKRLIKRVEELEAAKDDKE